MIRVETIFYFNWRFHSENDDWLADVKSQTETALARNVRLGARSVTVRFVVRSDWLGNFQIVITRRHTQQPDTSGRPLK
jgi:hypothetical protein